MIWIALTIIGIFATAAALIVAMWIDDRSQTKRIKAAVERQNKENKP